MNISNIWLGLIIVGIPFSFQPCEIPVLIFIVTYSGYLSHLCIHASVFSKENHFTSIIQDIIQVMIIVNHVKYDASCISLWGNIISE